MALNKETTNAARQILMNELGLTRESVRELTKELVEAQAKVEVARLINDGTLERLVQGEFRRSVQSGKQWGPSQVESFIKDSAMKMADEFIKKHIRIVANPEEAS